jgi:hypothetical protein
MCAWPLHAASRADGSQGTAAAAGGRYPGWVGRLFRLVVLLAFVGLALAVARSLQRQAPLDGSLNGSRPLIGSLDSWPAVPRAPKR